MPEFRLSQTLACGINQAICTIKSCVRDKIKFQNTLQHYSKGFYVSNILTNFYAMQFFSKFGA